MTLYAQTVELLETLYRGGRDAEKREALEGITRDAYHERGAYVNGAFPWLPSFVLFDSVVYDRWRLMKLEERIERLTEKLKTLGDSS